MTYSNLPADKLERIFHIQDHVRTKMSHYKPLQTEAYPEKKEQRINVLCTAIVHEAVELQRETPWKWWKNAKPLNIPHMKEELIDIMHFIVQLSMELGMDANEMFEEYQKKSKTNLERVAKEAADKKEAKLKAAGEERRRKALGIE